MAATHCMLELLESDLRLQNISTSSSFVSKVSTVSKVSKVSKVFKVSKVLDLKRLSLGSATDALLGLTGLISKALAG